MEISSISGEIFLSCMGLIIILVSVFVNKEKTFNLTYRLSLFSFVISGIIILITHNDSGRLFQEAYTFDGLARYSKLLILFGASMALLIGFKALKIDNLIWEQASDGNMFPHLYSSLDIANVCNVYDIVLNEDGTHTLPANY